MSALFLVLGVVFGAVASLVLAVLFQERLQERRKRRLRRRVSASFDHAAGADGVRLGSRLTRFHLVEGDGSLVLRRDLIRIHLAPKPVPRPVEVEHLRAAVLSKLHRRLRTESGAADSWQTMDLVALKRFSAFRSTADEEIELVIEVAPVDYATFASTVLELDHVFEDGESGQPATLRSVYLADEPRAVQQPIPFLANGLGVALVAFTDDDKILMTRRRVGAQARGGQLDVSVVEGMHASLDRDTSSRLDPYLTAVRGVAEELGVDIQPDQVDLLAFGVDLKFYQWNFVGVVDLRCTAAAALEFRANHAKDRWESSIRVADLDAVALLQGARIDSLWDTGLVALYLSLCHRIGVRNTRKAAYKVFYG